MPLQATSGVASYDAYGSAAAGQKVYIEDAFSVFLYTGNGSTQTITNGIDLAGKGGLVWIKSRSNATSNYIIDTQRGKKYLISNSTGQQSAEFTSGQDLTSFNSDGFSLGVNYETVVNSSGATYASWTWAKQPKFFDVVTYTGTGSARTVSHNLGSTPGCIIVKATNSAVGWAVYHRSLGNGKFLRLDLTQGETTSSAYWNNTDPTSTQFTVGTDPRVNDSGITYVAYLFAHDAGGFGDSGTDNVISCGSFTTDGSGNATVNLGYEPQWVLIKQSSSTGGDWELYDSMRGMPVTGARQLLFPNSSNAETTNSARPTVSATGFSVASAGNTATYIYIAIRRGPMRKPTSGASVYSSTVNSNNINSTTSVVTDPAAADLWINRQRNSTTDPWWLTRLTGWRNLRSNSTDSEDTSYTWEQRTQTDLRPTTTWWSSNPSQVNHFFRRAPGFFDVVCYTGTVAAQTISHSLNAAPELMIVKVRDLAGEPWTVYSSSIGNQYILRLNQTDGYATYGASTYWNNTTPSQSTFAVGAGVVTNANGYKFVAYLFATCPGVSKVGSYTGTGATLQIDCGFAAGARFVLIKRTDSTGDWYVWDSARGIVAGNDPYLLLNSTAAEVTTTDWVDTYSLGFELSNAGGNNVNINTASYIYLSIA